MPLVPLDQLARGLAGRAEGLGRGLVSGAVNLNNRVNNAVENYYVRTDPAYAEMRKWQKYPTYAQQSSVFGHYAPETLPKAFPDRIDVYRADPTGRYGGKDGLETMPTKLDPKQIYANVRGLAEANRRFGVPMLSAQQLAALALKEGMSGFGALNMHGFADPNSPAERRQEQLRQRLVDSGMGDYQANFASLVQSKTETAKRLGIPFSEAWNGTGHSYADKNTTGADYAHNYEKYYMPAAAHPKNVALMQLIQSAINAEHPHR